MAVCLAVPPGPLQVTSYSLVLLTGPVDADPLMAFEPLQLPVALQLVASSVVQVSVEADPGSTVVGFAVSLMVGAGAALEAEAAAPALPLPEFVTESS